MAGDNDPDGMECFSRQSDGLETDTLYAREIVTILVTVAHGACTVADGRC